MMVQGTSQKEEVNFMAVSSWHQGWEISEEKREIYRECSKASSRAKAQALRG